MGDDLLTDTQDYQPVRLKEIWIYPRTMSSSISLAILHPNGVQSGESNVCVCLNVESLWSSLFGANYDGSPKNLAQEVGSPQLISLK